MVTHIRSIRPVGILAIALTLAIAGCSHTIGQPVLPSGAPSNEHASRNTDAAAYRVLYSFGNASGDGIYPYAGLLDLNGTLYGATQDGGSNGNGAVFSMKLGGRERLLSSFNALDGAQPYAGLTEMNGALFGTTVYGPGTGCNFGCGTVFTITTTGRRQLLHTFTGSPDGAGPYASMVALNGTLYGTTQFGGGTGCANSGGCGTVYSMNAAGKLRVLYRFKSGRDGANPTAGLIAVNGTLYGTTQYGGSTGCVTQYSTGCGTVFSVSTKGVERVLYRFAGGNDGYAPYAGLVAVSGALYGTTLFGGPSGGGTVFRMSPTGIKRVLYGFCLKSSCSDGVLPYAGLIHVNDRFYGATEGGGTYNDGVIFSLDAKGTERVLHAFEGYPGDGESPYASLIEVQGMLYGTTVYGGAHGQGTAFKVSP